MPITVTAKTAVVSVHIDMSVDDAGLLIACLPELPAGRPAFCALSIFLQILADTFNGHILPTTEAAPPAQEQPSPVPALAAPPAFSRKRKGHPGTGARIDLAELQDLILQDQSTQELAAHFGVHPTTITKFIRDNGIARSRHRRNPTTPARSLASTSPGPGASAGNASS